MFVIYDTERLKIITENYSNYLDDTLNSYLIILELLNY